MLTVPRYIGKGSNGDLACVVGGLEGKPLEQTKEREGHCIFNDTRAYNRATRLRRVGSVVEGDR